MSKRRQPSIPRRRRNYSHSTNHRLISRRWESACPCSWAGAARPPSAVARAAAASRRGAARPDPPPASEWQSSAWWRGGGWRASAGSDRQVRRGRLGMRSRARPSAHPAAWGSLAPCACRPRRNATHVMGLWPFLEETVTAGCVAVLSHWMQKKKRNWFLI